MQAAVEIVVPEASRSALAADFAGLPRTRVVTVPSHRKDLSRLCVATVRDFQRPGSDIATWLAAVRQTTGVSSHFVVRWAGIPRGGGWAAFQNLATVASQQHWAILVAQDVATARRLVQARLQRSEDKLIATAEVRGNVLEVWSCEPCLYRVPIERLPPLQALSRHDLMSFEVSPSGSRLHWESGDIDLNLDSIRAAVDVSARREQRRQYRAEAKGYGRAIRRFRQERGLKQTDIAGLPERTVRRAEAGASLPRLSTLERLAAGHGLSTEAYMTELARRVSLGATPRPTNHSRRSAA